MKFLTDEMCGKINRWLRILGYDTTSPQDHMQDGGIVPDDDEIIEICLATHRILVSKDYEIIQKMTQKIMKLFELDPEVLSYFDLNVDQNKTTEETIYPCVLLRSTNIVKNLHEIYIKFQIRLEYTVQTARCPKCNTNLEKIQNPVDFKEKIPSSVYEYHTEFWRCSNSKCEKLFWKGTHLERIKQTLDKIQTFKVKDIKDSTRKIP